MSENQHGEDVDWYLLHFLKWMREGGYLRDGYENEISKPVVKCSEICGMWRTDICLNGHELLRRTCIPHITRMRFVPTSRISNGMDPALKVTALTLQWAVQSEERQLEKEYLEWWICLTQPSFSGESADEAVQTGSAIPTTPDQQDTDIHQEMSYATARTLVR